jgi:ubiquinone/menaquinone biosynthesis C-methylase UbiE
MTNRVAGDFDYEQGGAVYDQFRQTDPHIAAMVHRSLGSARTVLNVGAGAGSYEPDDRMVVAVEPSRSMRAKRPAHRVPAIDGVAEDLPFDDGAFEAAMATVTLHQWHDREKGLTELRRVSRGPVVILTFDGDSLTQFWLDDYAPELAAAERQRYPALSWIGEILGGQVTVETVPLAIDCTDGFTEAYYARPEQFLIDGVRRSQSAWAFLAPGVEDRAVARLRSDIETGEWDRRFGHLRTQSTYDGSLRLVTALP